jgi:hypothetical protein
VPDGDRLREFTEDVQQHLERYRQATEFANEDASRVKRARSDVPLVQVQLNESHGSLRRMNP